MTEIYRYPNGESLARAAADEFVRLANKSIIKRGRFSAALAGGSTPKALYHLLASEDYRDELGWGDVHLFWGDERCVSPDHEDSNYGMVRRALLEHIAIPEANVHRMAGEIAPREGAIEYHGQLDSFFRPRRTELPVFDLILLGMGYDGHTASLFPGDAALMERRRWVAAVEHTRPPLPLVTRLTLTLPVINAARNVLFLVTGESKANAIGRIIRAGEGLPAGLVRPGSGRLLWMLDEAAAAALPAENTADYRSEPG